MSTSTASVYDPSPTFHRSLRDLIAQCDAGNTPTGILATLGAAPFGHGALRDGILHTEIVDQLQWEQIYATLASGALAHATLPAFEPARDRARVHAASTGVVPIAVLDVRYQQPTRRLLARILQAQRGDTAITPPPGPLLEEKRAFAASSILPTGYWGFERMPEIHRGLSVTFRLDPDLYLSNVGGLPDTVELDFDDGNGFQAVAFGADQRVDYDEAGERRVVLRARRGGELRIAAFRLRVEDATAAEPSSSFEVTATIPHGGTFYKGNIVVYLGKGNTAITRPIVFAEGFPGGNTGPGLYDRVNGKNGDSFNPDAKLADALIERGYDLLFLLFDQGGAPIQGNAFVYLKALQDTWQRMGSTGDIIAAGGSMGGLVARYALAYAETKGIATGNVTALVTFDSPHVGANVPLAVQAVSRFFSEAGGGDVCKLLDLPAARQMLVAQRWTHDQAEVTEKPDYLTFYQELAGLGVGGYPSKIKKYAVSNGAGDGSTVIQPLTAATIWRLGGWHLPLAKAEAWCSPNGTEGTFSWCVAATIRYPGRYYPIEGTAFFTRDGCAGGTAQTFGQMADTFSKQKGAVWNPYRLNCFVPAHSALSAAVTNAHTFKANDLKPHEVPFTAWCVCAGNQPHATVDQAIKDWVLRVVAPRP